MSWLPTPLTPIIGSFDPGSEPNPDSQQTRSSFTSWAEGLGSLGGFLSPAAPTIEPSQELVQEKAPRSNLFSPCSCCPAKAATASSEKSGPRTGASLTDLPTTADNAVNAVYLAQRPHVTNFASLAHCHGKFDAMPCVSEHLLSRGHPGPSQKTHEWADAVLEHLEKVDRHRTLPASLLRTCMQRSSPASPDVVGCSSDAILLHNTGAPPSRFYVDA